MEHKELEITEVNAATYPSLKDKSVLITGGGSGIGATLVEEFCGQGAKVAFVTLSQKSAEASVANTKEKVGVAPLHRCIDLKDIAAFQRGIAEMAEENGPFTALINNAGNDDRLPMEEVTEKYWDDRLNTNLRHQFFAIQSVVDGMEKAGGGSVVNMGSNAWMQGAAGLICYTTAKAAIQGLTKCLARELGEKRIRVNTLAPGWILTLRQVERAKRIYPDKFHDYLTRQCLKEFLLPPDVARMAMWLAADDSRLVTSQTFIIDGGVV